MTNKCGFEGCKGIATGAMIVTDKETLKEVSVCLDCWQELGNET